MVRYFDTNYLSLKTVKVLFNCDNLKNFRQKSIKSTTFQLASILVDCSKDSTTNPKAPCPMVRKF